MTTSTVTKIGVGTTFRSTYADSNALWRVVKARGAGAWDCVIDETDLDYAGTKKVFGTEEIERALQSAAFWAEVRNDHDKFWASRKVGETVHYHSGFGRFVRGVVVEHEGKMQMRPTALVGKWSPLDLPRYLADGRLEEGYEIRKIRSGEPMQPNESHMVEGSYSIRVGQDDPRNAPAIDLTPPTPTAEQAETRRLNDIRDAVISALSGERLGGPDRLDKGRPMSEAVRIMLTEAKLLLLKADF